MRKIVNVLGLVMLMLPLVMNGQHSCQTIFDETMVDRIQNWSNNYYNNTTTQKVSVVQRYLPVTIHLVGDNDGSNRMSEVDAINLMASLNEQYENSNTEIAFCLAGFNYINNTGLNEAASDIPNIANSTKDPNSLNAYIMNRGNTASVCGVYYGNQDVVFMSKGCLGTNSSTWAHEFGHNLTLPHTFFGWEGNDYVYGTEAPNSTGWTQVERLNGSNCNNSGDRICDTKADYLSYRWNCNGDGESPGNLVDPNGETFRADGKNFMSYSDDACTEYFTPDQTAAMHSDIVSRRNYSTSPSWSMLDEAVTLVSPMEGEVLSTYDNINLVWEEVAGATHYILEVSPLANFNVVFNEVYTTETSYVLTTSTLDRKLYWRVKPVNKGVFNAAYSTSFFTTGNVSGVQEVAGLEAFTVAPNPITRNQPAYINIDLNENVEGSINIYDVTGRIVQMIDATNLSSGTHQLAINTSDMNQGMYFATIQTAKGTSTRKFIVTQ